jgi:hypothetical protein
LTLFITFVTNLFIAQASLKEKPCYKINISSMDKQKTVIKFSIRQKDITKDKKFTFKIEENKIYVQGKIMDIKGKLEFNLIDSLNKFIIKGQFANGLDILKEQITEFDADGNGKVVLKEYIEPLSDVVWNCYSFDNKILSKREHLKGIVKLN